MITVIVPTLNMERGTKAAHRAQDRTGLIECKIRVVLDRKREGFTKTVNRALADVKRDHAAILVDDCDPDEDWLRALRDAAEDFSHLRAWFAGPSGPCRTWPQNTGQPGRVMKPRLVDHLAGFCLFVRWEAIAQGLMDEAFIHYASEVDYQWRMNREHGAHSLWVPSVFVDHGLHEPHMDWWRHDQALLHERWHSTPGLEVAAG